MFNTMFGIPKIKNLESIISRNIENEKKIVETRIARITFPSPNYGTTILGIDIVVKDEIRYTQEILSVVAKLVPEKHFFRKLFNCGVTFKNEVEFYEHVIPLLKNFQNERRLKEEINYYPKFYGARLNLDESNDTVDDNAVLILENLSIKGYNLLDGTYGCSTPITKLILKKLSHFHALPLAFKLTNTESFKEKIQPHLEISHEISPWTTQEQSQIAIIEVLKESPLCLRLIPKIKRFLASNSRSSSDAFNRHFHTICHNDMWTKNIFVKFELGNPTNVVFVGHSFHSDDSVAKDIIMFFLTSVETRVLRNHFDELLRFYYHNFVQNLKDLKVPILQLNYDLFLREFAICTKEIIGNALFVLLFVIYGKDSGSNSAIEPPVLNSRDDIPLAAKERVWWFVEECERRGWLND